jgi:hypothetical protein
MEAPPADAVTKPKRRSRAKGTAGGNGGGHGGALVIVESPTKAKTIGKYLGSGYTVKATVGHVRDLPKRELGWTWSMVSPRNTSPSRVRQKRWRRSRKPPRGPTES